MANSLRQWLGIDSLGLPEYRERHLFLARLRLVVLLCSWGVYSYFLRNVISQTWPAIATVGISLILTSIAYYAIVRGRFLVQALMLELVADLAAITAVIYLTGGPYSPYFTLYILYCMAAGLFYHYRLALGSAIVCAIWYAAFLTLCDVGIIPPLAIHFGGAFPSSLTPIGRLSLLVLSMAAAAYGLKIAGHFVRRREHALELRNRELTTLHKLSSAIRRAISLRSLIDQIFDGAIEGLGFETALLFTFNYDEERVTMFAPRRHDKISEIDRIIGHSLNEVELPWDILEKPAFSEILKHKIIFRKDVLDTALSFQPVISATAAIQLQQLLGVGRVVAIPLVIAGKVFGTLIGFSKEPFVEDRLVQRFEAFGNQAALFLEAVQLIDKLQKINDQLGKASQAKSEFLALMGHELRTPLTAIIGFTELLIEGVMGEVNPDQKESLEEVVRNSRDLLAIINSLLDLSKAEAGKIVLEKSPVNWHALIDEAKRTIRPLATKKGLGINLKITEAKIPISVADPRKIRQALINLLSNAIKFTPSGGVVGIELDYFANHSTLPFQYKERVADNSKHGFIVLSVEDSGIGIALDHLEKVFEPFHQVDSSMTRSYGGTGLGLALTKQFVDLHQGTIWAESRETKGTRFVMVIPSEMEMS